MRRPTRPSRPTRSERRRERSEPSERPVSFMGTCTRRPSVLTTMATWRRLCPSNRPKTVSRTRPGQPGRFAQSTRHSVIAQPPGPHVFARAGTKPRWSAGPDPDPLPGVRWSAPDAKRPPVTRRSRHDLGRPAKADGSPGPALPCLENECRAGEGGESQQHSEGVSLQHPSHGLSTNEGLRRSSGRVTPGASGPM